MKGIFYTTARWMAMLFVGVIIGLTIKITSAWVEPDQVPPEGNIAAPLNTGNSGQIKTGGLILNTGGATLGLIVDRGLVGIGTNNPQATLDVNGTIRANSIEVTGKVNAQELSINGVPLSSLLPSGMIAYFDLTTCPAGWSEVPAAKGRYLVGTQNSANKNLAVGQALGDGENRPVGQHNHGAWQDAHNHGAWQDPHQHSTYYNWLSPPGGNWGMGGHYEGGYPNGAWTGSDWRQPGVYTDWRQPGVYTSNTGSVAGTNAPYVEFLTCRKN